MSKWVKEAYTDFMIVTDWEEVDPDDFYLSDEWLDEIGGKERQQELINMANNKELFIAYEVPAVSYAQYTQMDAIQVFIDKSGDVVLTCESAVIGNDHEEVWESTV
jgi:hypothetical protein